MTKLVITDKELQLAGAVARRTATSWRLTDFNDIQGELYLWLTIKASNGTLDRYRLLGKKGYNSLALGMKRHALKYAIKQTETITGSKLPPLEL